MTAKTTSSREDILGKVRSALGRDGMDAGFRSDLEDRVRHPKANKIPARPGTTPQQHLDVFITEAERVSASVVRVASYADIPKVVARYLADANLPTTLKASNDETLRAIPWANSSLLTVHHGVTDGDDLVGVSKAFAGVAETGTLVMRSSANDPTLANYLPDVHIAIIDADTILPSYEAAWAMLRK